MQDSFAASRVIAAPCATVWAMLTDPDQHRLFDDTGMVGQPVSEERLTGVGQVFTMKMTYTAGGRVEHYQSDNHVTIYQPHQAIAWMTATPGGPTLGWTWRYDVHRHGQRRWENGDDSENEETEVRVTYDWAHTPAEHVVKFGVPLTDEDGLARSLAALARAVETSR